MWRIYGGVVPVIAGIAAFLEARYHAPVRRCVQTNDCLETYLLPRSLSRTPYDLLLLGAWALVILGALTIVIGLIRYSRRYDSP